MRTEDPPRRGETPRKMKNTTERIEQEDQRMHQRQKKEQNDKNRYSGFLKNSEASKVYQRIKSGRKKTLIPKVKNDEGVTIMSRKAIANVSGGLYSKLFAENQPGEDVLDPQNRETRRNTEKKSCNGDVRNEIPEFTQIEVQAAIERIKKGKASDNNGIRAEGHQDLRRNDERDDQTDLQGSVETR